MTLLPAQLLAFSLDRASFWMGRSALALGACFTLLAMPNGAAFAQNTSPANATATAAALSTAAVHSYFLHRTQANETVRKIAFRFLDNPSQAATLAALIAANDWAGKPQAKTGFVFESGTPVRIPTALMLQSAAPARVLLVTGDVQLMGADKTVAPAQLNAPVPEGAQLLVGATGRAVVGFPDESRMDVQAGSKVLFSQLRRLMHTDIYLIDVQLEEGRMEARVNPKRELAGRFNVQSRRTLTGVRGTVFRVGDAAGRPAVVEVLTGEVGFSAAGTTVGVPSGKGSFLEPSGTPAQPVNLLAAPLWTTKEASSTPLDLAAPLPLRLPLGAAAVIVELTGAEPGAVTRSIELKATQALILPASTPLGNYALVAKAVDANGLQGLPMAGTVGFLERPFPPAKISLNTAKNQLEWANEAQALLYELEIFAAGATAPQLRLRTPHQFLDLSPLPAGRYRARIATVALKVGSHPQEKPGMPSAWFDFVRH